MTTNGQQTSEKGAKVAKVVRVRDPLKTLSPSALGFGSVPGTPEEARAHVQKRVRAYAVLFAVLWSVVFLAQLALRAFADDRVLRNSALPVSHFFHILTPAVLIGTALLLGRGPRSMRTLDLIDVGLTKTQAFTFALLLVYTGEPKFRTELVVMLAATNLLAARAALIPCTAARTALLGAGTMLLQALATYWVYTHEVVPEGFPSAIGLSLFIGLWGVVAVLSSVVVAKVIHGLERRVQETTQLGQYTLEKQVGLGGMGLVYLARHALLRRPTAIKLLLPDKAGRGAVKRFEREVQLTSQINHPNVVAIYDYGRTPDGVFYYAMEYLDGVDLDRLVRDHGPLPAARVRYLVRQIAEALAEAHAIGLIHRDVKPANIVVLNQGRQHDQVKVLDFGLVKDTKPQNVDPSLSNLSTLVGTPLYLSPESITNPEKVDQRSDIYALGAVAYFLLAGEPFIKGRGMVEICAAHMYEKPEPPSARLGKPIPASLEAIVLRCLEKDPANRPQTASDVVDLLDRAEGLTAWSSADARAAWQGARQADGTPPSVTAAAPPEDVDLDAAPPSRALPIDLSRR